MRKAARGRGIAPQSLPRFRHESNRIDLIETDAAGVTTRGITRFQLTSIAIGAISNPSVSATVHGPRSLVNTGDAGHRHLIGSITRTAIASPQRIPVYARTRTERLRDQSRGGVHAGPRRERDLQRRQRPPQGSARLGSPPLGSLVDAAARAGIGQLVIERDESADRRLIAEVLRPAGATPSSTRPDRAGGACHPPEATVSRRDARGPRHSSR